MQRTREIVSTSLDARTKSGFKVRQPLKSLTVYGKNMNEEGHSALFLELIKDEVNVKEVIVKDEKEGSSVELDTTLTKELKEEGMFRDLVRAVQGFRKESGLSVSDRPTITAHTSKEGRAFIEKVKDELVKETGLMHFHVGEEVSHAKNHKDFEFPLTLSLEH